MIYLRLVGGILFALAIAAGLHAWGQWVARNDVRLLAMYDQRMSEQRLQMTARACGKRGTLWTNPETGRFACIYEGGAMDVIPEELRTDVRFARN